MHGIRAGFNTTLHRNATDPSLRMRLMRHKSTDLGLGTYDKVEVDELRRELERLPIAETLRVAAGAERSADRSSVPITVPSGPTGAGVGRSWPETPHNAPTSESANVARERPSWPVVAEAGRAGPVPHAAIEMVGPAGLEPATTEPQSAKYELGRSQCSEHLASDNVAKVDGARQDPSQV